MLVGGGLATTLSRLVGSGPGSGMAVMFLFTSLLGALTGLLGLLSPAIRRLDQNPSDTEESSQQLDTALIPQ